MGKTGDPTRARASAPEQGAAAGRGRGEPGYISQVKTNWSKMWHEDDYQFCELNIPTIPSQPGSYTLFLYFNNAAVTSAQFTVTE